MTESSTPKNTGIKFNLLRGIANITRKFRPRGTGRFLNLIYNHNARWNDYFSITMEYDSHLLVNVDSCSAIEWNLFFYGYYETEIDRLIKHLFRPGFIAFDIGANIGCHTLIMGLLARESGTVVAVEPEPKVFKRLIQNIQLNRLGNIKPLQCAFSDARGRLSLYSPQEGTSNQGNSSLYVDNVSNQGIIETQVDARRLDEVMELENYSRLDFIKIDTEGNEYKVLLGAQESIRKYRPYIIFEYNNRTWTNANADFESCQKFFAELAYSLYVIRSDFLTKVEHGLPKATNTNILAVP